MNTEKLNAIKEIKAAISEIELDLSNYERFSDERTILEKALGDLEVLVWKMVNQDLKGMTTELSQYNKKLKQLSVDIKETDKSLKKIGERIAQIAKITAALVKMVETAIKAGLM
ncbi:MAG: hypothetical protein GQ574_23975 [Crocinitomix sp.]|nr:hypothetical protein [Crocinitomix sp.]